MLFQSQIYASFVLVLFSFAVLKVSALNYASVSSGDFMLQWTYNNSMLMFKLKCKTTGWCGVGFTTTANGRNMVNYDAAVGGVDSSNMQYFDDYQLTSTGQGGQPKDPNPDYTLTKATQEGGYTNVEFYRNATTGDPKDVQFMNDTEVWIVWAYHASSDSFGYHGGSPNRGIVSPKHNLIMEAMSAAIQPSTTMMQPSTTMMQPSTTMMQPSASTPAPTTKSAGSDVGSRAVTYAILTLIVCVLHF